jgi:hypothetical protein
VNRKRAGEWGLLLLYVSYFFSPFLLKKEKRKKEKKKEEEIPCRPGLFFSPKRPKGNG